MKRKYRLYHRANGTFYAEECSTGARESLATKVQAEAEKLLSAKNDAYAQPALSRELAKAYVHAQDPKFGERTWTDVARLIDGTYTGSTKERFQKFIRSAPALPLMNLRLAETCSSDFLEVFAHAKAGVSTNMQLRILHNRALDLEWILRPVLSKKAWPKILCGRRKGITREQHEAVLRVTPNEEYRRFFELLWHTGGSQSDIACLEAEDIDWDSRRLFYLAVVIDLCSRKIIGWALAYNLRTELVSNALKQALISRKTAAGIIFHSDRGSQYGSATYRQILTCAGMRQSMFARANPYHNAWTESFMGTLKTEMLQGGTFIDSNDARTEIFDYIESYYNQHRKHSSLKYQSPAQFEAPLHSLN